MHAVLEGELGECEMVEGREAQNVRNHALIHYLATLANSNSTKDTFDFDFVESLLKNGADVNSTDKTGQTIFHEIARSWNIDVAKFLITNGNPLTYMSHEFLQTFVSLGGGSLIASHDMDDASYL